MRTTSSFAIAHQAVNKTLSMILFRLLLQPMILIAASGCIYSSYNSTYLRLAMVYLGWTYGQSVMDNPYILVISLFPCSTVLHCHKYSVNMSIPVAFSTLRIVSLPKSGIEISSHQTSPNFFSIHSPIPCRRHHLLIPCHLVINGTQRPNVCDHGFLRHASLIYRHQT